MQADTDKDVTEMAKGKLHKKCLTDAEQETIDFLLFSECAARAELSKAIEDAWPKIPAALRPTIQAQIIAMLQAVINANP